MMRAMPYWSVSPNAMSAYIPPSTSPERTMSSARVMRSAFAVIPDGDPESSYRRGSTTWIPGSRAKARAPELPVCLLPRRLGDDRLGTLLRDWRDAEEVRALPLANGPDIFVEAVLQFHL